MNTISSKRKSGAEAFTLIELILVVAILAILISLLAPVLSLAQQRADSAACAANLRQIGIAVNLKIQDNDQRIPRIETDPTQPVYAAEDGARPLLETLRPYGLAEKNVQCRTDLRTHNYFAAKGTSYEWKPMTDDELIIDAKIYAPFGTLSLPSSLIRLATDFDSLHRQRQNILYADGHVRNF
jgi:prepilin-type N-terminal cleavage/methylation domain-containing protein/prepilin-type processing-associated H-X9-DG protein